MAGIYFHFPFCRQACHYCNFHFSTQLKYQDEMLQAFKKEIELRTEEWPEELESIYFGGGSPSLLSPKSVEQLINLVKTPLSMELVQRLFKKFYLKLI